MAVGCGLLIIGGCFESRYYSMAQRIQYGKRFRANDIDATIVCIRFPARTSTDHATVVPRKGAPVLARSIVEVCDSLTKAGCPLCTSTVCVSWQKGKGTQR